jgi:hypothetical protein
MCGHEFSDAPATRKSQFPPEFLSSWLALGKFMRLSSMKAAHAVLSSAAYRKSGSRLPRILPARCTFFAEHRAVASRTT